MVTCSIIDFTLTLVHFRQCSMAYHHFASPAAYTKTIAYHLKPGGKLLVADFMTSIMDMDSASEKVRAAVPHLEGFSENAIREMFEGAGLVDFKYAKVWHGPIPIPDTNIPEQDRMADVFLAEGTQPAL